MTTPFGNSICKKFDKNDADAIILKINDMWGQKLVFPGPQPISIERKHLKQLKSKKYFIADKTDGTRYALLCTRYSPYGPLCAVIDRSLNVYALKLKCPSVCYDGSLFDCELVREGENWVMLIFDCVAINGDSIHQQKYENRIAQAAILTQNYKFAKDDPFILRMKEKEHLQNIKQFLKNVKYIEYKTDGLIFTPDDYPVITGTHNSLFKWKEQLDNTVDFQTDETKTLYLQKQGTLVKTRNTLIINDDVKIDQKCIIECKNIDQDGKVWEFVQFRKDKNMPNALHVFRKTLVNIKENIKIEEFY
tara:strand:- start:10094 stop:11008 length:915 start_codon:yes stop_codon:yes gene_type:complete